MGEHIPPETEDEQHTTTVQITTEVWAALDRRKGRNESFDDVIRKLIDQTPASMGAIKPVEPEHEPRFADPVPVEDTDETCVDYDVITGETCGEPADYKHPYVIGDGNPEENPEDELYLCEEHAH